MAKDNNYDYFKNLFFIIVNIVAAIILSFIIETVRFITILIVSIIGTFLVLWLIYKYYTRLQLKKRRNLILSKINRQERKFREEKQNTETKNIQQIIKECEKLFLIGSFDEALLKFQKSEGLLIKFIQESEKNNQVLFRII